MAKEDRRKRIDELLLMIGGLERSIYMAQDNKDWETVKLFKQMRKDRYERLERVAYGLPEERKAITKPESE